MTDDTPLGFNTLAIHAGAAPDPTTKARVTPIYQTTSFVFDDVDHAARLFNLQEFGNIYSRVTNPTNDVLEQRVAALEGGTAALAVGSGHAAQLVTLNTLLTQGDEYVAVRQLYGGSVNQFDHAFKNFGWHVNWADTPDPADIARAITPKTKLIFIESIANPGGVVTDIAGIAAIADQHQIPLVVDNTLATPYLVRPFEHGAHIVVHSLTKFLGGHGNSIGGIVVDGGKFDWSATDKFPSLSQPNPSYHNLNLHQTFDAIAFAIGARVLSLRALGPALAPMNAFLFITGIETLPLRMQRHCDSALKLAQHLESHPDVAWVSYAGLPSNPYHANARKYAPKGAGAVFTFGLKGGYDAGVALVKQVNLFSHLANVGDTRSLIIHPSSTTHRQLTADQQIAAGAGPDVVRLSVGLEDPDDLIADLNQALAKVAGPVPAE